MKNRKLLKITLLLLSLLVIGSAVGIGAFADTEASVEIVNKNISYEGAVKILYAIDAENVGAGQTVKVRFYENDTLDTVVCEKSLSKQTITLNGKTYSIVFSDGIAPKDMRKPIYAEPVVLNSDGSVAAAGEVVKYNVWQYATNRFDKSCTAEQKELYSALLDYGAAVQRTLIDSGSYTEAEAMACGGYIDEYYGLRVDTYDGNTLLQRGETEYYSYESAVAITSDGLLNKKPFEYYANGNGTPVDGTYANPEYNAILTEPGTNVYRAVYEFTGGSFSTFDEGSTLDTNKVTVATNAALDSEAEATASYTATATVDGVETTETYTVHHIKVGKTSLADGTFLHSRHSRVTKILDSTGAEVDATIDGKLTKGMSLTNGAPFGNLNSGSSITFLNKVSKDQNRTLVRHVYQFDVFVGSANGQSQGWFVTTNNDHKLWGYYLSVSGNTLSIAVQGHDNKTNCPDHGVVIKGGLDKNKWHTVRFEYYDLPDDKMAVYAYVDGYFCPNPNSTTDGAFTNYWDGVGSSYVTKNKEDSYVKGFSINYLYSATQMDTYYDNVYMATEYIYDDSTKGVGQYVNDPTTSDFDYTEELAKEGKTMADIYSYTKETFLGFGITASCYGKPNASGNGFQRFENEGGDWYLSAGTNNAYVGASTRKNLGRAAAGEKYVVEFDFRFHGFGEDNVRKTNGNGNFGWLRLYDDVALDSGTMSNGKPDSWDNHIILALEVNDKQNNSLYTLDGYTLPKSEWATIRIEATPDASSTKLMSYVIFVNGVEVKTGSKTTNAINASNATFSGAIMQGRSYDSYYAYDIDNFYVGVIGEK